MSAGPRLTNAAIGKVESATAVLLSAVVLALLAARAHHAGALWRDECATVQLALMPTLSDVMHNFQRESFPPLLPLTVRGFAAVFGSTDAAFRIFAFVIGAMLVIVAWLNARSLKTGPPLLLLALIGLNTTFLIWGIAIRGYGIGSVAILLLFGLIGKLLLNTQRASVWMSILAAVITVQFLLYNSVLLLAMAIGVVTAGLARKNFRPLFAVRLIGIAAAISLLPSIGPFSYESQSTIVFAGPVEFHWLWEQMRLAFGYPLSINTALWTSLALGSFFAAAAWIWGTRSTKPRPQWDFLVYALVTAVLSVALYFVFLKVVSYRTREWYYLALLTILAANIEVISAHLRAFRFVRLTRLLVAFIAMVALPFAVWPKIIERATNADVVARQLEQTAQSHDLIVVNPWFLGISFHRYYRGTTAWVTCPIMTDHNMHRFDLLKDKMASPNQISDLLAMVSDTLRSNHSVWIVGSTYLLRPDQEAVVLPPAPQTEFGWNEEAYAESWSQQLGDVLRKHADSGEFVAMPDAGPINQLEKIPVFVAHGWH